HSTDNDRLNQGDIAHRRSCSALAPSARPTGSGNVALLLKRSVLSGAGRSSERDGGKLPLDQHVVFLLLGLANGAVFASLALALVVTYRSSGVINFATGAIALLTAYLYAFLRTGKLLLLIPGLPRSVDLPA